MKLCVKIVLLFGALALGFRAQAAAWSPYAAIDSGNAEYSKGNYDKAINFYNTFTKIDGYRSAQVYYNMGNCYYRKGDIANAILNYERAKKLAPSDPDIQFNLQIANLKTVDKIIPNPTIFITNWWRNLTDTFSEKGWGIMCIIFFFTSLVLLGAYFMSPNLTLRQMGFWGGALMLIFTFSTFMFAHQQYNNLNSHDTAIVMSNSVTVTGAPATNATHLFVIHEGTKVQILEKQGNWMEVKLANGNQGWLHTSDVAEI